MLYNCSGQRSPTKELLNKKINNLVLLRVLSDYTLKVKV